MISSPTLSVLMPVYNNAEYLTEAIDSILVQSYTDFEFIIIDDGSIDATPEIVRQFARTDSRVIPLQLTQNRGVAEALNYGLDVVRGNYLARMDGEDLAMPDRFLKQIAFLESHPEVGILGTQTKYIDENGDFVEQAEWIKPLDHNSIVWRLLYETPICHPSIMARTHIIKDSGGYDSTYPNEDMHLWTRLAVETRLVNRDETLLFYRMPPSKHDAKLLYWEPHIQRVAREYMETILERAVDPYLVENLFLFQKYGSCLSQTLPPMLADIFDLCALLEELFQTMLNKNIITLHDIEDVSKLISQQIRQLVVYATIDHDFLAESPSEFMWRDN